MKLQELYSHTSLEQGMIYIADSIKQHNAKLYNQEIETWINQTNYINREQKAIELKRSGNFTGAINIYNRRLNLNKSTIISLENNAEDVGILT